VEQRLLRALVRRLENSFGILEKAVGSECAHDCYRHLMEPLFSEKASANLDLYEQWVERCARLELGRPLTEAEEQMLGEVVSQITGITELLFNLAGVELFKEEDPEEAEESPGP
ncbi:MAG: hypothetical protein ACOY93_03915, partial [Bacillota bacterium]